MLLSHYSHFDNLIYVFHEQWQKGSVWKQGIKQTRKLGMSLLESLSSLCQCLWLLALTLRGCSVKAALHNCECVICAALILLQTPGFLFLDLGLVVLTGDERVQLAPLLLCRGQRPSVPAVPPTPRARRTRWHGLWQPLVAISCVSWHPAGIMISVLICLFRG